MANLNNLNLKPDSTNLPSEDDIRRIDAFVFEAEMLLDDERCKFAWATVASMRDSVRDEQRLPTEKMWQALKNIKDGGRRHARSLDGWKRRYEGGW
jgi:hypothetical protein